MSINETYLACKSSAAYFEISSPSLFLLEGEDCTRYLHGRITQDVKSLNEGDSIRSLLLTPQGKVTGHFVLHKSKSSYLIISDPIGTEQTEEFISSLLQFKVADQVNLTSLENHQLISIQGPKAIEVAKALSLAQVIAHQRSLDGGVDIVFEARHKDEILTQLKAANIIKGSQDCLEILRVEAGIPRYSIDINNKTIAPELPYENLISFNKGCYAGQEVVEMAVARGRPNRKLCKLELDEGAELKAFAEIRTSDDAIAGQVTSICQIPTSRKIICLGFVKKDFLDEKQLLVGNSKATLQIL